MCAAFQMYMDFKLHICTLFPIHLSWPANLASEARAGDLVRVVFNGLHAFSFSHCDLERAWGKLFYSERKYFLQCKSYGEHQWNVTASCTSYINIFSFPKFLRDWEVKISWKSVQKNGARAPGRSWLDHWAYGLKKIVPKWVIQIRCQISSSAPIATCKQIKDVPDVMKHFTAAESIKNCIGGSTKTNAVHLK